jgi:hypothetical protein
MTSPAADTLRDSAVGPTAAVESTAERVGAFAAFRSRPFLLFWSTIFLSLTGVRVPGTRTGAARPPLHRR